MDENLIWTEKERRVLFETPVFNVTERLSQGPDGQLGKYIVNEASDWAIVMPVHNGNFLMVKQWRHGEKALSLEFPGGVIEKDELPVKGAERELLEETGAVAGKIIHLGSLNPNPALFANHVHIFCAFDLSFGNKQNLDKDEFLNCLEMPIEEVIEKVGSPQFQHALMASAVGLFLAKKNTLFPQRQ